MRTGGGGGWGDPFERDADLVRRDVAAGLLTAEQARERYGVVVTGSPVSVDQATTAELRATATRFDDWIDRGQPVPAPVPGEFRALPAAPEPWLVIGQPIAVREQVRHVEVRAQNRRRRNRASQMLLQPALRIPELERCADFGADRRRLHHALNASTGGGIVNGSLQRHLLGMIRRQHENRIDALHCARDR